MQYATKHNEYALLKVCTTELLQTTHLDRNIILLICSFCSEDIRYFFMRCRLPANGTFNWAAAGANAVLLDDDCYALITKTVSTRQHCPLCRKWKETQTQHSFNFGSMQKKNSVLIYDKLHFHWEITLFSWYSSD